MDTLLGNYGWILVLLIFLAPLVALWWAARRVRRWWRDRAKSKAVAELAAPEVQSETGSEAPAGGYSFPLGVPLVVYPLLLLAIRSKSGTGWAIAAHITYFLLLGLFLWEALNRKEYEKIRANDPSLNRITWLLNWLLFFVALPLVAWLFFGLPTLVR